MYLDRFFLSRRGEDALSIGIVLVLVSLCFSKLVALPSCYGSALGIGFGIGLAILNGSRVSLVKATHLWMFKNSGASSLALVRVTTHPRGGTCNGSMRAAAPNNGTATAASKQEKSSVTGYRHEKSVTNTTNTNTDTGSRKE